MDYQSNQKRQSIINMIIMAIIIIITIRRRIKTQTSFIDKIRKIGSKENGLYPITVEPNGRTSIASDFTHPTSFMTIKKDSNHDNNHNNNSKKAATTKTKEKFTQTLFAGYFYTIITITWFITLLSHYLSNYISIIALSTSNTVIASLNSVKIASISHATQNRIKTSQNDNRLH